MATKEEWNGKEAQAGRHHGQAAHLPAESGRGSFIASDVSYQPRPAPRFGRSVTRTPAPTVGQEDPQAMLARWGVTNTAK